MVATAAHLTDHVLPALPVRQWVLAVPKRLRYFLQRDATLQGAARRLFLRAVESCMCAHSPGAGEAARLGAVAFIHRFGSTLNAHLHFHCVVIDGVFDSAPAGGVIFRAATELDANAIAAVQACVRRRLLRIFARRDLLPGDDARAMAQWQHGGGFSVDGSVRIEAEDRAGRERLLRYCARQPFALDRRRELDPERLLYASTKPGPGGDGSLLLTPLALIDRIATLVPPPRVHRHRYFGVPARTAAYRKSPLRRRTAGDGRYRQLMSREATTAIPGNSVIRGGLGFGPSLPNSARQDPSPTDTASQKRTPGATSRHPLRAVHDCRRASSVSTQRLTAVKAALRRRG